MNKMFCDMCNRDMANSHIIKSVRDINKIPSINYEHENVYHVRIKKDKEFMGDDSFESKAQVNWY